MITLKSPSEISRFVNVAANWLQQNPASTKLSYAINKVFKETHKALETYNIRLQEIDIENASTDPTTGVLLVKDDKYQFTKPDAIKRNRERVELMNTPVQIQAYFATALPDDLHPSYRDAFIGFVIEPQPEDGVAVQS